MENEELVRLIRDGHEYLIKDLYRKNKGMVYRIAKRYAYMGVSPAYDVDDFMQVGYFALVAAVKSYDEGKGKFSTYLHLRLRGFMRLIIWPGKRKRADDYAVSLDEIIPGSDDIARVDALEDRDAVNPHEAAELQDLQKIVREAVDRLPFDRRETIRNHYFYGQLLNKDPDGYIAAAHKKEMGLNMLRRDPKIQRLWEEYKAPVYRHVTLSSYRVTRDSAVELAAMRREKVAQKMTKTVLGHARANRKIREKADKAVINEQSVTP